MKILLLAFGLVMVLTMKSQADEPGLATASVGLEAAVKSANAVMVVRFVNLGSSDLGGPGETIYQGAEIEVISAMKGVPEKRIPCTFRMRTIPFEQRESLPEIGLDYVIAGSPSGGDFEIGKLLSATPENIALVKAIIGSQPSIQSTDKASPRESEQVQSHPKTMTQMVAATPGATPTAPIPNEEPTSSAPWSGVAVLIIAATGLLWLLLKKR